MTPERPALLRYLPAWAAHYPRVHLGADVMAGLTVAVLVIPQSLAYALLAGLPPQAGLFVSILPVLVYAFLGSSMTQALGPAAITAVMTATVLTPLATPFTPEYIALAAAVALLSGIFVLLCGVLRLGFLAQLLSRPVVSGFIAGSAVLIVVSQLKPLLGLHLSSAGAAQTLLAVGQHLDEVQPTTVLLSGLSMAALWGTRWGLKRYPMVVRMAPLLVLACATTAVSVWGLDRHYGVAVVGSVQQGLGHIQWFIPDWASVRQLAVPALVLGFIGMVQSITMAQALAVRRHERIDANQELVGLGAANITAAFYGGMPVGGGMSRSAFNTAAGAQTPLAGVVTAVTMLLIVASGTSWLERMPVAVLAASILVAAIGMVDIPALRQAWSYDKADAVAYLGTAGGVLLLGLELGIAIGIGLSLATLLWHASAPHIAVIGRLPGSEHFRNVERYGVETRPSALLLRIDESLFFGNLNALETRLQLELERQPEVRHVVLVMSGVNRVDTTAMEVLTDVNRELHERGIALHLAEVKGPVQDRLAHSPLWKELSGQVHLSVNAAFEAMPLQGAPAHDPALAI
jgi:sulfate permease, SulP family